jgi:hypothetical protein
VLQNGTPTGATVTVPPPAFGLNTDSTVVGGLTNGTAYTFTVHATNIGGKCACNYVLNERGNL